MTIQAGVEHGAQVGDRLGLGRRGVEHVGGGEHAVGVRGIERFQLDRLRCLPFQLFGHHLAGLGLDHHTVAAADRRGAERDELWLALARNFYPFRKPVVDRIITSVARENAIFAVASALPWGRCNSTLMPWIAVAGCAVDALST